ncbi:MAG: hypothetical protein J2P17_20160, partial [Mycobacterium sp.]|nr:hypothetical protein [Mycobacterium sp.]
PEDCHDAGLRIDRRAVVRGSAVLALSGAFGPRFAQPAAAAPNPTDGPGAATADTNLLPNPGFEEVVNNLPSNWSPFNAASVPYIATATDQVHAGTRSVRLSDPATNTGPGLRSARIPVTAGESYRASVLSFNVAGTSELLLEFWNSAGSRVSVVVADNKVVGSWEQLTVLGTAPSTAVRATVLLYLTTQNVGSAYFDDAALASARWLVDAQGGDYLIRRNGAEHLSFHIATRNDPAAFDGLTVFGTTFTFTSANQLNGPDGQRARWESDRLVWDSARKMATLPAGTSGRVTVSGFRFTPPARQSFGSLSLHETNGQQDVPVWFAIGGYAAPDHAAERAGASNALAAARRASDYFETLRTPDGAVLCAHTTWPGDLEPEPQSNASIASGNLRLWTVTGDQTYRDRAIRTLDWLVSAQKPSGGFGLPWAWGAGTGHFDYSRHYPENGSYHPAGTEYGIITASSAQALLEGYKLLDDHTYLDATLRAVDYLLYGPTGFQWLDDEHTIGSVPYCTLEPIDSQGGRTTNVYNIDGSVLQLLTELFPITLDRELRVRGDAMATNLIGHIEPDSSIAYSWYAPSNLSTSYAEIVYEGLVRWGTLREKDQWVRQACDGMTWITNVERPQQLLWEIVGTALGGVDNTSDVLSHLSKLVDTQLPDGSWTGGVATRTDAVDLATIGALLLQMEP